MEEIPSRWDVDDGDLKTLDPGSMISGNCINMYCQLFMVNMKKDFVIVPTTWSPTVIRVGEMRDWTAPPMLSVHTLRGDVWRPERSEWSVVLAHIPR